MAIFPAEAKWRCFNPHTVRRGAHGGIEVFAALGNDTRAHMVNQREPVMAKGQQKKEKPAKKPAKDKPAKQPSAYAQEMGRKK